MLDFLKADLPHHYLDTLMENDILDFQAKVNIKTGELENYSVAYFKGITFKIHQNNLEEVQRITFAGSLHKYWNNGEHNYNDFDLQNLDEVLQEFREKLHIYPEDCFIKQLEVGVNFKPPFPTPLILKYCMLHKTTLLRWVYTNDEGSYKQAQHKYYFVKAYDKRKHYQNKGHRINHEIMRFELKYRRNQLNQEIQKEGAITLQDILDFGISNFKTKLLKEWDNVLFYDFTSLDNTPYKERYSNPNYWTQLKKENFKYHRKKLNKLIYNTPKNLNEVIREGIRNKIKLLSRQKLPELALYI